MHSERILACLLVACIVTLDHGVAHAASVDEFVDFSLASLPGRLFVPPEANDSEVPRPLVLFLHGAGETGTNNVSQVNGNIDNLLSAAKQRGAFLYAPQATTFNWSDSIRTANVMQMVDRAIDEQNIDPNRLYVTGLSMGGGGTWNMLNRFSDRFAAGVPIAAVSPVADFEPDRLVDKPIWAYHARDDSVVSKNTSRVTVNRILGAANEPTLTFPPDSDRTNTFEFLGESLNYTEWPTGGHGIWSRVYGTAELRDWIFAQSLLGTSIGEISLNGTGDVYRQDFDEAFSTDGTQIGVTFPIGWTHGRWGTTTTASFPVGSTFDSASVFNAGPENDSDRALAVGVTGTSDEHFLQLSATINEGDASSFRLQFDVEAWDARDGVFVEPLNRYLNTPADPGEAAFAVTVEMDSGDGFSTIVDLGMVTTGPNLQPVMGGIVDGNTDVNRISFDSGVIPAAIPAEASLRIRWAAATEAETFGWVFGLDNVSLDLFGDGAGPGDFNFDGVVDVADLDVLTAKVVAGTDDLQFDLDGNEVVNSADRIYWVTNIKRTFVGDANLDGRVDSMDLNSVALSWQDAGVLSWSQGDFTGDGIVNASDLNDLAVNWQAGDLAAVPEPCALALLVTGVMFSCGQMRRLSDQVA